MSQRSIRAAVAAAAISLISVSCSSGGGSTSDAGPQPDAGTVVYTNPVDTRLLRVVDAGGTTVFHGTKDEYGRALAVDRVEFTPVGQDRVVVRLDEQLRPWRFELADGSGLRADWRADGLVRFRCLDPLGAIVADLWIDAMTGAEVPEPPPLPAAIELSATTAVAQSAALPAGNLDPLQVAVRVVDCLGNESSGTANLVERCEVALSTSTGPVTVEAVRALDRFQAVLPRQSSPSGWSEQDCTQLLAVLGDLCIATLDQRVSGALTGLCGTPAVASNQVAFYSCVVANAVIAGYCGDAQWSTERLCSGAVTVVDLFASLWSEPGERQLQAQVVLRNCGGADPRVSDVVLVDDTDAFAVLTVDGCVDDPPVLWSGNVSSEIVGGVVVALDQEGLFFDPVTNTYGPVGFPLPLLGPRTVATTCEVPELETPAFAIDIEKTVELQPLIAASGGGYGATLDVSRTVQQLRDPTAEEVQGGIYDDVDACLMSPQVVEVGGAWLYVVRLRPLERLVVDMKLLGQAAEGVSDAATLTLQFPTFNGLQITRELETSGVTTLDLTHDELLEAYQAVYGSIPLPPGYTGAPPTPDSQCLYAWFTIEAETRLEVSDDVEGSTSTAFTFDVRIVPE